MPAYNGEKYIGQAIESVISQTYSDWELIIVDDGSGDATPSIARSYSDQRIKYFFQENRGQAAALNHGLELASGSYITTLDTDDWLTPHSIADRVNYLEHHPDVGVVYGDGVYCDAYGKPLSRFSDYRVGDIAGDVYDLLIITPFFGTGGNVMIRGDVLREPEIRYDESIVWCQDYDMYIRIAERAQFGVVPSVLIWYRLHTDNMTISMPNERRLESLTRVKHKVMSSARFQKVPTPQKVSFFYHTLIHDLADRVDDQMALITSKHFRALPKREQGTLQRWLASYYLATEKDFDLVRTLLKRARSLQPFDPKTILVSALASLHPNVARQVVGGWRRLNNRKHSRGSSLLFARGN